jgi:hypothetical protein
MDYDPTNINHRTALAMDIQATLLGLGFARKDLGAGTREEVYFRNSTRIRGVEMRIYTSIVGGEVRDVGGDSIKVCAVYGMADGSTRGLMKERRVFRTGQLEEIAGRVKDRIRLVALDINGVPTCRCGGPMGKSKAGKDYCMALCWKKS